MKNMKMMLSVLMIVAAAGACGLGAAFAGRAAAFEFFRHGNYSFQAVKNSDIIRIAGFYLVDTLFWIRIL